MSTHNSIQWLQIRQFRCAIPARPNTSHAPLPQNEHVPDIAKAIFGELGYSDFKDSLTGTYDAREYCVQYRETAFDFISRLFEEEGIFYFFTHAKDKHQQRHDGEGVRTAQRELDDPHARARGLRGAGRLL